MSSNRATASGLGSNRMLLFRRMELKYLIDRTTRTALTRDLRAFMQPDKHTEQDGSYIVRSLYFDTQAYKAYHEKMSGAAIRHKLRVRAYGADPSQAEFVRLEVKSRYVSFIYKITVDVPIWRYGEIEPALLGYELPPEWILNDANVSKEFFRLQRQLNMQPMILVQYRREAYERRELNRVRVNFDDQLMATRHLDLLGPLVGARPLLRHGNCIFEIKVDGAMPFWLHMLIGKYNLQNEAISKFCHAIRSQARFSMLSRPED